MTTTRRRSSAALAALLILSLAACTSNELQADFNLTASLSQTAAATISSIAGLDPAIRQTLVSSLTALSQAASEGSADLAVGPLTPAEITDILAKLSTSIITTWPAGIPPVVLAAVQAAVSVAQIVIGLLQSQQPSALRTKTATTTPSSADMANLKTALAKYQTAVNNLQKGR